MIFLSLSGIVASGYGPMERIVNYYPFAAETGFTCDNDLEITKFDFGL